MENDIKIDFDSRFEIILVNFSLTQLKGNLKCYYSSWMSDKTRFEF